MRDWSYTWLWWGLLPSFLRASQISEIINIVILTHKNNNFNDQSIESLVGCTERVKPPIKSNEPNKAQRLHHVLFVPQWFSLEKSMNMHIKRTLPNLHMFHGPGTGAICGWWNHPWKQPFFNKKVHIPFCKMRRAPWLGIRPSQDHKTNGIQRNIHLHRIEYTCLSANVSKYWKRYVMLMLQMLWEI